ncbi:sulfate transporter 4.1, chloroplastic-like protein [Tanacetum coccineum]
MEITYASSSLSDLVTTNTTRTTSRPVKVIPFQHPYDDVTPTSSSSSSFSKWGSKVKGMKTVDWLDFVLPCCRWMRSYNWRENLQPDVVAGLTVGVMLVPQSMSYAKLAGLQPIYGLYTGLVPVFVYSIFGSSRQLAVGPVALTSLLVSNVLGNVDSSTELYTELAILLSLLVGILECTMGLLRLGWLIRFISHSVISGFTTASAFVIALSQAKYFLGYDVDKSSQIIPLVKSIISGANQCGAAQVGSLADSEKQLVIKRRRSRGHEKHSLTSRRRQRVGGRNPGNTYLIWLTKRE